MKDPTKTKDPCPAPWEQDFYQTGCTTPPKSHRGLVAFFLASIILVAGIVTGMNLLRIQLFWQQEMPAQQLRFAVSEDSAVAQETGAAVLGFYAEEVSAFDRLYYRIPQGLYIRRVAHGSAAAAEGLLPGDILLSIDGQPVSTEAALQQLLAQLADGTPVRICIYRNAKRYDLTLTPND